MALKDKSNRSRLLIYVFILLVFLISLSGCDQNVVGYTGTPVKVLVVMMKWNKLPNCPTPEDCAPSYSPTDLADIHRPRHTAPDYVALLDEKINGYYQKATYGQVYFDFELLENPDSRDGWWNSMYSLSMANKMKLGWKQLAMNIAYTAIGEKLRDYDRVLFISNMQHRGGQMCCLSAPTPYYAFPINYPTINFNTFTAPVNIPMIVAEVGEGQDDMELITVASHELAHSLGAPDQYYGGKVGMGPWDLMDQDWDFFHFGAWTKLDRDWINWEANTTKMPCDSGSCEITTVLDPVEIKGNNALLIPVFGWTSNFTGFMAECRKPINGDENIPENGVLVTFSNPFNLNFLGNTISQVHTNEANPYALLQPGESFYNSEFDVRILNVSQPGDSTCTVKALRSVFPRPDLSIAQASATTGQEFIRYKSPDIWIDTNMNGPDVYPSYEMITQVTTQKGSTYNVPSGYGDPIVASGTDVNTAWGLFHNNGTAMAEKFKVNIYMRQPLTVKVQTEGCGAPADSIGTQYLTPPNLLASAIYDKLDPGRTGGITGDFNTTSTSPLEIKVEIEPALWEINLTNNVAFETYTYFYGHTGSETLADIVGVTVSEECKTGLPYVAAEVPALDGSTCEGWDLSIYPSMGFIEPGEVVNFTLSGVPLEGTKAGDTCNAEFSILMPINDVFIPVESFNLNARVVDESSLTCSTPGGVSPPGVPVTVLGKLTPDKGDIIALVYTDPTGKAVTRNLSTNITGQYSDQFTPTLIGTWYVKAMWVGDEAHAPTESTLCQFKVEEKAVEEPPTFVSDKAASCREGPSALYRSLGVTTVGSSYIVNAASDVPGWFFIQYTEKQRCWVKADNGRTSGKLEGLPILHVAIITITPTLVPTITPTPDFCRQLSHSWCVEKYPAICKWEGTPEVGLCVAK